MNGGIAVAGSILVDEINTVGGYPNVGELTQIKSVAQAVGGLVPNVGVDLKKLCPSLPVYAYGKVANDQKGSFVTEKLRENGLDTQNVITTTDDLTSFTQVISVDGGQRTFFTYPGTSAGYGYADIDIDGIKADIFHLGYFLLLKKIDDGDGEKILKKLTDMGVKTSIDLVSENSDRYKLVTPVLKYVDYLIVNELEAGRMADIEPKLCNLKAICEKLMSLGVREKVIIHFREGAVSLSKDGFNSFGSLKEPNGFKVGSTGAGDAFCAGSLLGIYNGLSDKEILRLGTLSATASLRTADATSGVDTVENITLLCKDFPTTELAL